jgi:hypothetical protein
LTTQSLLEGAEAETRERIAAVTAIVAERVGLPDPGPVPLVREAHATAKGNHDLEVQRFLLEAVLTLAREIDTLRAQLAVRDR